MFHAQKIIFEQIAQFPRRAENFNLEMVMVNGHTFYRNKWLAAYGVYKLISHNTFRRLN